MRDIVKNNDTRYHSLYNIFACVINNSVARELHTPACLYNNLVSHAFRHSHLGIGTITASRGHPLVLWA